MPSRLLPILLLLGLTLTASAAWAVTPGPYLALEGYGTWLKDSANETDTGNFSASYKGGIGGGIALGYDMLNSHPTLGRGRVELELASRRSKVDKLEFVEGTLPASGYVTMNSLIVNTIADYRRRNSPLVPYVSLGAGYAEVAIDQVNPKGVPFIASSSDWVAAYQVGAGVGIGLGEHLTVDVGYRYFTTEKPTFKLIDGSTFKSEIVSHNLLVGLRYKF